MSKGIYLILQEIMEEKGLSIASVAQICSLPDSTVRGIINRKQKSTALEVAFKLSNGLGVSLERLNGDKDTGEKFIFQSKRLEYIIKVTGKDDITELSAQAGVDVMTFTSWINGKAQPPYEKVELLAFFLGVTSDYLMGLTNDPKASIKNDEELSMPFDAEERIHLKKYNSLNDANRQVIDTTIDAMLATQDAKKGGALAAKNGEKESDEVSKNVG